MQALIDLYFTTFQHFPSHVETLPPSGGHRRYFRLTSNRENIPSVIGVEGTSIPENETFLYLAQHFHDKGLPVPRIYGCSNDHRFYLQADLGSQSLFDALSADRQEGAYHEAAQHLLSTTIRQLAHIQVEGAQGLSAERLLSPQHFNAETALFDLNYFKYCFLKTSTIEFDEVLLQTDFEKLANDLARQDSTSSTEDTGYYFLYRDFQARNVMWKDGPHFIDFQGGKIGPLAYDVASFLWQASSKFPNKLRQELVEDYLDELSQLISVDRNAFKIRLQRFVFFRLLQVLGAYGLRGKFEQKPHFLNSIAPALGELHSLLQQGVADDYLYLKHTLLTLIQSELHSKQNYAPFAPSVKEGLMVTVYSFSYKKGIPADKSGNGGGHVFDCRAPHNPGKFEQYKHKTGLDADVIDYIEQDGELPHFLAKVYPIVNFHVERFLERGFSHLQISFGCTGGQHRSVYSAQHLAEYLHKTYHLNVHLIHREQKIEQWFHKNIANQ